MFNAPEVLTKELKIQQITSTGQRRIRLSTNFLHDFGFSPGTRIEARLKETGFDLVPTTSLTSPWKVHERGYKNRRNNPREAIIDIQGSAFINHVMPAQVERLHFTLLKNLISVRPVYAPLFNIRRSMQQATPDGLRSFLALSSGLDGIAFANAGFKIRAVFDWRPPEARDQMDLSESGICSFLANLHPQFVFNEDITTVDMQELARRIHNLQPLALLSIGIGCDDFSTAKAASLKRAEISEFRPGTRELGYYALRLIDQLKPACCVIENVPGYLGSEAQAILGAVLRRIGYYVQAQVLNAFDYGALTRRRRCYLIASCWPGFNFPSPDGQNSIPLGQILRKEIPAFSDQSHTKTIAAAKTSGRDRFCDLRTATASPTVLKSQARKTKDSLYFQDESGRILYPTLRALKTLHGFGDELNLDTVSEELAVEQIGQGIDRVLHEKVARRLFEHITLNCRRPKAI